jgi:hypothetical protein
MCSISLESLSLDALAIDNKLTDYLSGPPSTYAASIYDRCIPTSSSTAVRMEVIIDPLANLNAMQRVVSGIMVNILQIDGVGKAWQAADKTNKRLKQVVTFVEDIYCYALLGASELIETHRKGDLLFQS